MIKINKKYNLCNGKFLIYQRMNFEFDKFLAKGLYDENGDGPHEYEFYLYKYNFYNYYIIDKKTMYMKNLLTYHFDGKNVNFKFNKFKNFIKKYINENLNDEKILENFYNFFYYHDDKISNLVRNIFYEILKDKFYKIIPNTNSIDIVTSDLIKVKEISEKEFLK